MYIIMKYNNQRLTNKKVYRLIKYTHVPHTHTHTLSRAHTHTHIQSTCYNLHICNNNIIKGIKVDTNRRQTDTNLDMDMDTYT